MNPAMRMMVSPVLSSFMFQPQRTYTNSGYGSGGGGGARRHNGNGYSSYTSSGEQEQSNGRTAFQRGGYDNRPQYNNRSANYNYQGDRGEGYDLPRFYHRGSKVFPKSLPFVNEEHRQMLSIEVAPAQWRKENNSYLVKRMGYILFNFFEINEEMRIDSASKRTFVVTPKNMDTLLDLDPRAPYKEEDSNEELLLYRPLDSEVMNILKVTKNADRTYTFTYCEMADGDQFDDESESIQSYNEILLKPGQVRMVQNLCEYGLPTMVGLHAMYNPQLID